MRHRRRPPAARDRQPGPDRRRAQRPARGPPGHHRRGGRRAEVPPPQGEERAPPGRDRGQPHPAAGPAPRGPPPAAAARAPGRRRPPPRRRSWPSSSCCASTWPGASWPPCRPSSSGPPPPGPSSCAPMASCKSRLAQLDTAVMATEARLTAMGGDDLGDSLAQFESLYEKARGLGSLLAERRRGIDRDRSAFVDQGVIATLEAEAARLAAELREVDPRPNRLEPLRIELAAAEQALAEQRARYEDDWADGVAAAEQPGRRGPRRAGRVAVERRARRVRAGPGAARGSTAWPRSRPGSTGEADRLRAEIADGRAGRAARWSRRSTAPSEWRAAAEAAPRRGRGGPPRRRVRAPRLGGPGRGAGHGPRRGSQPGGCRPTGRHRRRARHAGRADRDRRRLGGGLRGRRRRSPGRRRRRRGRHGPSLPRTRCDGESLAGAVLALRRPTVVPPGSASGRAAAPPRAGRALVDRAVLAPGCGRRAARRAGRRDRGRRRRLGRGARRGAGPSRRHGRDPGGRPVRPPPGWRIGAGGSGATGAALDEARARAAAGESAAAARPSLRLAAATEAVDRGPTGRGRRCRGSSTTTTVA